MNRKDAVKLFVNNLEALPTGDRAILKRNAGNTLSEARGGATAVFYKILPFGIHPKEEELWFIAATLRFTNRYIINTPEVSQSRDFGRTMHMAKSSDSFDIRVRGLLDCSISNGERALAHRLRQMVKLADSKNVPIDWEVFILDLLSWDHPNRWVQKKWARSYFGLKEEQDEKKVKEE
jgi:CRISPR system Cascade subunit CasB